MTGNSALIIPSETGYICCRHNLLQVISVNCCPAHLKGKAVLVIVMSQDEHNVWLWQLLLAADIFNVEYTSLDYVVEFNQK